MLFSTQIIDYPVSVDYVSHEILTFSTEQNCNDYIQNDGLNVGVVRSGNSLIIPSSAIPVLPSESYIHNYSYTYTLSYTSGCASGSGDPDYPWFFNYDKNIHQIININSNSN